MHSASVQKLIDLFAKFPSVGPRTAQRFVFYLIKNSKDKNKELIGAIEGLTEKIKICGFCGKPYEENEGKEGFCEICSSEARDKGILCIVEKEEDLEAIEKTNKYKGLYFILGGTISGFEKQKKSIEEKINNLIEKLTNKLDKSNYSNLADRPKMNNFEFEIKEIILALNPTPEGENTSLLLERKLKPLDIKITRLARGLPKGGELEYADEETIFSALQGRK